MGEQGDPDYYKIYDEQDTWRFGDNDNSSDTARITALLKRELNIEEAPKKHLFDHLSLSVLISPRRSFSRQQRY
jgi:hypothetical protein